MSSPRSSRAQARRVYSSAGRRRRKALGRIAAAAAVLLALALAWSRIGDDRLPRAGTAAGSHEADSGALSSADGYVAVGASLSPYSDEPAVARLDPVLRDVLRQAASDAGADGITLRVNGGWRSSRYQQELLDRAVETYGSIEAARQYALPPAESKHVTGGAVDVGPTNADDWLSQYGSEYGLCQIYANEPWHFELATAPGGVCPPLISNAAGG